MAYHFESVFTSMEIIMTLVIEESDDISSELLCSPGYFEKG